MSLKSSVMSSAEQCSKIGQLAPIPFGLNGDGQLQSVDNVLSSMQALTPGLASHLSQADHYQVALVPLPRLRQRIHNDAPMFADLQSVLVLPLTWKEVVTRLRSQDSGAGHNTQVITFGANSVSLSSMEVRRAGKPLVLTALEFKLLRYLLLNPERVISRDELLNEVWGFDNYPCTRTVDTHMWRLRQKLESDPANPDHFHTVHAMGYKFLP
jgi:hypothetical protein